MAVFCTDTTGLIGQIILGLTNITGSLFLSLLFIMLILLLVAIALDIPIEVTAIIYLPLLIALVAACSSEFLAIFGCFLIYLGVLLAKNLLNQT